MFRNAYSKSGRDCLRLTVALGLFVPVAFGQLERREEGFELGSFFIRPEIGAVAAYDNRVLVLPRTEGDLYGELIGGVRVNNRPAKYDFAAAASYGYRSYSEYSALDDDFYRGSLSLGTGEDLLNWSLKTDYRKSLNYNTLYNPYTGAEPDSVLTDQPNTRSQTRGAVSYSMQVGERTSIVPEYGFWHYYQEFVDTDTAEWQVHRFDVPVKYAFSDKTLLSGGGGVSYQTNKEEDGYIGTLYAGVESRATEKTVYSVRLGVSAADYEVSGTEFGGYSDLRILWRATEKVSAYVFGGNRFEPGYGGGDARMVYRAGYGADWKMTSQWSLGGQGLHDYQQAIGSDGGSDRYDNVRHFYTARIGYKLPRWAEIALTGKYVNDEIEDDQIVVAVRVVCRL